jgi:hypothetical protein
MAHRATLILAAALLAVALAVAAWLRAWGAMVLLVLLAGAFGWYRAQVARGAAAERFFGDAGEDTRMTALQSPSEMPVDRQPPAPPR